MAASTLPATVLFDFSARDLASMVATCESDELLRIIEARIPPGAAILEAGAGSGRWLKALTDRGYAMTGVELSLGDVERFRQQWPEIPYHHGDVEALPYADGGFDAVMSLGVVEHLFRGPERAIAQMRRVLKPQGVLLLSVPCANPSFRLEQVKDALFYRLFGSDLLRRLMGRPATGYKAAEERERLRLIRAHRRAGTSVKYRFERGRGRDFYEYRYRPAQIRSLVEAGGFSIEAVHTLYASDRLYQIFGRLLGRYDGCAAPRLNGLGRLLARTLPSAWVGHMTLLVARPAPDRP